MSNTRPKVLAIIGRGRSGSTILDNILGEIDGFFSAGELHNLWKRGLLRSHACGCGKPLPTCPFWTEVFDLTRERLGHSLPSPEEVVRWQDSLVRPSRTRKLIKETSDEVSSPLSEYVALLECVYGALAEVTGARVIVDSSKRPAHAALFHLPRHITPYFVQLVRDPRAVAYSRTRMKSDPDDRVMRRDGPFRSGLRWLERNREAEAVRRRHPGSSSMLVRYEDFVADPGSVVAGILKLVGEEDVEIPISKNREICLGENHTAAGNPSRFKRGHIKVRVDDEWVTKQKPGDRIVAAGLSLPLLGRYGYQLRVETKGTRPKGD
ncbi:sulfotransferase [soil metagenome]